MNFVGKVFWRQQDKITYFVYVCEKEEDFVCVKYIPFFLTKSAEYKKSYKPMVEYAQETKQYDAKGKICWSEQGPHLEVEGKVYRMYRKKI